MMNQRGFSMLEMMMVVCIIGVLSMIAMTEFNKVHNRAFVGAAINDVQILRKALAMYDAEWGAFPQNPQADVATLLTILVNPDGQAYIDGPSGTNFASFQYTPPGSLYGDYAITVVANDMHATQITVTSDSDINMVRLN
jgi:prepilin-type N-terminal cleavage/methylation domain-containing protein